MAEKSFKKIRCVHAVKNSIHFIPEHLLTDAYLKENQFIVQEFEGKPEMELTINKPEIREMINKQFPEKVVEEKLAKAPKSKLVKK